MKQTPTQPQMPRIPEGIYCAADYARLARAVLPAPLLAYIAGGSGAGRTRAANRAAYARWAMLPRALLEPQDGDTRLRLGDQLLRHPFLLAPVAYQVLVQARGELETARGAAAADAVFVASSLSSQALEAIAPLAPQRWFQLYLQPRREDSLDLLRRAEAAGYRALMLTVDAAIQQPGLQAQRAGFRLPADCVPANLLHYAPPEPSGEGEARIFATARSGAVRLADLDWLLAQTRLPLWVKGVLQVPDALALKARGVAGIVVSNHGGRGLDGAPASLQMLPLLRAALGADYPLLLDGGIRSGSDAFKALALGADAVLIGRLQVYALAVAGALGVAHLLRLLREELEICMALCGCARLSEIRRELLIEQPALLEEDDADLY